MTQYDFSRLSVLVVEDSKFMQSLILSVLRALGVERVTLCENGEEAIKVLTPLNEEEKPAVGKTGVDLIFCDMFMPVVDGAMFLRWVRRSEKSPDRFLPIIMISAAADTGVLFETRDAGIDEFLVKPFSATTIVNRIRSVIETPRPYIYCPTYFGPDRRRKHQVPEVERRVILDDEIEVLHSGRSIPTGKNNKKRVWIFKLKKQLREKLTTGFTDSDSSAFDDSLIAAIEEKISEMEGDYADWVSESIQEMNAAHKGMIEDPSASEQHMTTINRVALELRGQGGIFGYPLMTQFGKSLYETTMTGTKPEPKLLELIEAHINLIKVVMNQKIKGDGGTVGRDLLNSLAKAKKKFSGSK